MVVEAGVKQSNPSSLKEKDEQGGAERQGEKSFTSHEACTYFCSPYSLRVGLIPL